MAAPEVKPEAVVIPSFAVALIRGMVEVMVVPQVQAQALAPVAAQEPVDMLETVVMGVDRLHQLPVLVEQAVEVAPQTIGAAQVVVV